jgi:hypothetical protein
MVYHIYKIMMRIDVHFVGSLNLITLKSLKNDAPIFIIHLINRLSRCLMTDNISLIYFLLILKYIRADIIKRY